MQLPHLRTNYGKGRGFFSLAPSGERKARAHFTARAKNDKSSSFGLARIPGLNGDMYATRLSTAPQRVGSNLNIHQRWLFLIHRDPFRDEQGKWFAVALADGFATRYCRNFVKKKFFCGACQVVYVKNKGHQ